MTMTDKSSFEAGAPNAHGYKSSRSAGSPSRRDEFFAHVAWPTGRHVMSIDTFLRALQRDVAWDFFYGTVNFDTVFGTVNHYGNVDMFAGRYNDAYRKAELDHVENFDSPMLRDDVQGDARRLDERAATTRSPARPRPTSRSASRTATTPRPSPAAGSPRRAWSACPATSRSAPTRTASRSTGCSPTSPRTSPRCTPSPASRPRSPPSTCSPTCRVDVTWNPSVVGVCKDSLYCPTTEEYILPVIHGNDRVEWFVQLSDEIIWDVQDRDTGAPRAKVTMRGRRRRGDARRHPPSGLQPEALDVAGVGERLGRAARTDRPRQGSACTRSTSDRP